MINYFMLPLNGKQPYISGGVHAASDNPNQHSIWQQQFPNCNWGLVCGEKSGVTVLDIDIKNNAGGLESLKQLCTIVQINYEDLFKSTLVVKTASGGYHLYFKYCPDFIKSTCGILPGIDIRNNNTYVVFPNQLNGYTWENGFKTNPFNGTVEYNIAEMPLGIKTALLSTNAKVIKQSASKASVKTSIQLPTVLRFLISSAADKAELGTRNTTCHALLKNSICQGYSIFTHEIAAAYAQQLNLQDKNPNRENLEAEYDCMAANLYGNQKSLDYFAVTDKHMSAYVKTFIKGKFLVDRVTGNNYLLRKGQLVYTQLEKNDVLVEMIQNELDKDLNFYIDFTKSFKDEFSSDCKKIAEAQLKRLYNSTTNQMLRKNINVASDGLYRQLDLHKTQANYHICQNVILDISKLQKNGKPKVIQQNDGSLELTRQSNFVYNPKAVAHKFNKFLEEVQPDAVVRKAIQRYFGYALTNDCQQTVSLWFLGKGSNGKSLLTSIFSQLLGSYAGEAKISNFLTSNSAVHTSNMKGIFGTRLCVINETPSNAQIDLEEFKRFVDPGNNLQRDAGDKKQEAIKNSSKLIFNVNEMPAFKTQQNAVWRRMWFIKFEKTFTSNPLPHLNELPIDYNLEENILSDENECSGILNWALAGLLEVLTNSQNNIGIFDDIAQKGSKLEKWKHEVRKLDDILYDFFEECVEITNNPNDGIKNCFSELRSAYTTYERNNGNENPYYTPSPQNFRKMVEERVEQIRRKYPNVALHSSQSRHERRLVGVKLRNGSYNTNCPVAFPASPTTTPTSTSEINSTEINGANEDLDLRDERK